MSREAFVKKLETLIRWTEHPDPPHEILNILKTFKLEELLIGVAGCSDGTPAARILWMEYAQRRKLIDFHFEISVLDDKVTLKITGEAKPLHAGPIIDNKN
jgi:hypothetical protein